MREKIAKIIEKAIGAGVGADVSVPEREAFGHYATNAALRIASEARRNPIEVGRELIPKISSAAPKGFFEKIEVRAPGFVNFWITADALRAEFARVAEDARFGVRRELQGKKIMVEFTDANPFKLFHIGHLMSNTIGEAIARLMEEAGADMVRANYQGDVGLHVAMSVWGMKRNVAALPSGLADTKEKVSYLGEAYAAGSRAYREDRPAGAKAEIENINEKIYSRSDVEINALYDSGKAWSLAYFEEIYRRLGTKFDASFFESDAGRDGLALVSEHKGIFAESDGAIVFRGEPYGLHTRVFVSARGLPTYEAKELGLNKKKFELYPLDLSVIVTGNEILEYFKVLLKVMELTMPSVAQKTRHVAHGMLRLLSGKMSSRTGEVITAESLIEQVKTRVRERARADGGAAEEERESGAESVAIGAIKYSILKQNPGRDIVFDFEKSLSVQGDSGPYLQYAYARLRSIMRKAGKEQIAKGKGSAGKFLENEQEFALMRKILDFPHAVAVAGSEFLPNVLCLYLYDLANLANAYYESTPGILKDENVARRSDRLILIETTAAVLRNGLDLLGIGALEKI